MKIYWLIVVAFALTVGVLGICAPYLMSAKNTEFVLIGWLMIVLYFPIMYYIIRKIIIIIQKKSQKKEEGTWLKRLQ